MPIPKPESGEDKEKFISRCMSFVVGEGTPQKQAFAICSKQWESREKAEKLEPFPIPKPGEEEAAFIERCLPVALAEGRPEKFAYNTCKLQYKIWTEAYPDEPEMKIARLFEYDEDGTLILNPNADGANADWIRSARLKKLAESGDEEAARELKELASEPVYYFE